MLAELVVPAVAVALSPIPAVVVLMLLVQNERPRVTSLAYLVGRAAALTLLAVAFRSIPWLSDAAHRPAPRWTDWTVVCAGAVLVILGARTWQRRHDATRKPAWYSHIGEIPPPVSVALGLLPPLANPKVIAASVAAGRLITAATSASTAAAALVCYVAVSCSTVAAPVVIYLVAGPRIDPKLERLRDWIQQRRHATSAATLAVVGVAVMLYGLGGT